MGDGRNDVPVLIVGGGPVGLALALELGWLGIECLLVEQTDGAITDARLVNLNMRTMEFCRRWGIADEVRDRGFDRDFPHDQIYITSLAGHLLAHQRFPALAELRTPPTVAERIARCPQTLFTEIERRKAASFPSVTLRYETRCERVTQDGSGVIAELRDLRTGRTTTVRAGYLAACEGAGSAIREALGIKLLGSGVLSLSTNVVFRSDALLRVHDKGPGFYVSIGPEGRWANLMAVDGQAIWRLQIVGSTDPAAPAIDPDAAIRRFVGRDFAYDVVSVVKWTRRELVAERFGEGRIFLLGDAAHQLSPAGGFGGNTGIADATNLAWKLAAVTEGWGGAALLSSYEQERGPIGRRNVIAATDRFRRDVETPGKPGPAILADGEAGETARQRVRERLQAQLDRANCGYEYGARYEDAGLQLGYRYEDSSIVVREDTPPPPDDMRNYYPVARPGARAPHFWLAPNQSILDLFGRGYTLLRLTEDAGDPATLERTAFAAGVPLAVHTFDHPQLAALYNRKLALVRPDGHVAWRGDAPPDDARALIDRVRGAG